MQLIRNDKNKKIKYQQKTIFYIKLNSMGNHFRKTQIQTKQSFHKFFLQDSLVLYSPFTPTIQQTSKIQSNYPSITLKPYSLKSIDDKLLNIYNQDHQAQSCQIKYKSNYIYAEIDIDQNQHTQIYRRYFPNKQQQNIYLANILYIKDIPNIKLFSQINQGIIQEQFYVQSILNYQGQKVDKNLLDINKKLNIIYICSIVFKLISNVHINPNQIILQNGVFQISNVELNTKLQHHFNLQNIVIWLFSHRGTQFQQFQKELISIKIQNTIFNLDIPTMLKQILIKKIRKQVDNKKFTQLLEGMIIKGSNTLYKMDSFHACTYYKGSQLINTTKQWIYYKKNNIVYFFNLSDYHFHICQLVRKKKKINLEKLNVVYDQQQCQLIFPKNKSTHLLKANEFELQLQQSISDITLYQKLPIQLTNPRLFKMQKQIYILQKNLYKLNMQKPKVLKQIFKFIYKDIQIIPNTKKKQVYVILQSKDIFKQGIKVWTKQQQLKLRLAGNQYIISQLSSIQLDLYQIDFCIQVYFNIYVILACRNMFILDLNYKCFFSYASLSQIQRYQQNKILHPRQYNYMFQIKNQNFVVQFPSNQSSNNACFKNNKLNIIGLKGNQPLYLIYIFQPVTGSLILETYKSLLYQSDMFNKQVKLLGEVSSNWKKHIFPVDNQQTFIYKYQKWRYQGQKFLKIIDFKIIQNKNYTDFIIFSEPVSRSLKQQFQGLRKNQKWYNKKQILHLLFKILQIFIQLQNLQIVHRNFLPSHIYFTERKQLKITSWTQPNRIQYISDFKDLLLLFYNVITNSNNEKLTIQILESNFKKFEGFEDIYKIIHKNVKNSINQQKNQEIENMITNLKNQLEIQLTKKLCSANSNEYVFNISHQQNIFYIMNIYQQKLLKYQIIEQDQSPFLFDRKYNYLWNQVLGVLYILTQSKFKSIKLDIDNNKQKLNIKIKIQDQQFLPKKIKNPSMCLIQSKNLIYCFGGLQSTKNQKIIISKSINTFDIIKLYWQQIGNLCYTLAGSSPVVSQDGKYIYLFGGTSSQVNINSDQLKIFVYDVEKNYSYLKIDCNKMSPFTNSYSPCPIIFKFSLEDPVFVFYEINKKRHQVSIIQLLNQGLKLNFCIQQQQNDQKQQAKKPNQQINVTHKINYSSKDKNIYYLNQQNKLFVVVFNNICEPFLEVVQNH